MDAARAGKAKPVKGKAMIGRGMFHHERCVCGHCRCEHIGGFQECAACTKTPCVRYTWPGRGADLPADHRSPAKAPTVPPAKATQP